MSNGQIKEYEGDRTVLDFVTFVKNELEKVNHI